jgi:hypothetical protein
MRKRRMGSAVSSVIRRLIDEELRRVVADAIEDGVILSAPATAATILRSYPHCGMTERLIADRIMLAAADAGVAVELGAAKREKASESGCWLPSP